MKKWLVGLLGGAGIVAGTIAIVKAFKKDEPKTNEDEAVETSEEYEEVED